MQDNEKPVADDDISEDINSFIQKHRRSIFATAGVLALAIVVVIVVISAMSTLNKKAVAVAEELNERYESLRSSITEDGKAGDVAALIADIEAFAGKKSGYAAGRAWAISARIHGEKKEWVEAENAWVRSAQAAAKTYLAPLSWFNAGVAAEEQGKTEEAIEHYTKAVSADAGFSSAPRAQFSIGRLLETSEDNAGAIAAYREVISRWPNDTAWHNLALSRIIALESR